jgi:hypothetical protein
LTISPRYLLRGLSNFEFHGQASVSKRRQLKQLAWREYLPLVGTVATWAVIVLVVGHADAARLLAATIAIRAIQFLTKLATPLVLKRRLQAPKPIRRQARRLSFTLQAGALLTALVLVAMLMEALKAIGQGEVAAFLPFIALGMPARYLRFADVRTASPYYRLAAAFGGLAMVLLGWLSGWQTAALAVAFGAREWIAYVALRWWPREPRPPRSPTSEPLRFAEVARYTAIFGRRLLTYRLSKSLLTVFGPVGNVAARTGRGLKWHEKLEPYVPHHLGGFILFTAATWGGAAFLALRSGEPAAMVGAAGLLQVGAAAANVVLVWRYLPPKGSETVLEEEDEE